MTTYDDPTFSLAITSVGDIDNTQVHNDFTAMGTFTPEDPDSLEERMSVAVRVMFENEDEEFREPVSAGTIASPGNWSARFDIPYANRPTSYAFLLVML